MFDFSELKIKSKDIENWLSKELSVIRTGRATPVILDFVQVEAYGSKMSIKELANILVEDAKTVRIEPWDLSVGRSIEKAIGSSNLGLSVAPFEKGLRIIFPELTAERREQFVKVVGKQLEEAKVSLRNLRDKTWKAIEEKEKSGGMGEDDKFRMKEEMQKIIDDTSRKLEESADKKEKEIKI
ncbi:MAG: ribosome recycling factor [Candidatus Zambryskibacteria bacterium RIFCSPLOWO2_01_FULL_39_39]|uniref:Ribosome recycling factor n=1 Tax=Candidatus Zambryskibacteria bacterium RIFCSPLOWO2_01_FULL_39_39 TaxID=1802758 RepID=A0A1G2TVT0_9BACT|nr:MAG: Ribosome-recycling factor [Parcubacteria group bacterium GW2011_GWA1_38_7]OHA86576.1 MAG: ribosome recycling factor [Candidatus Zambryskibacteria bacterium RIFCSPHIGHO2_01_FULL_39_63]OHA94255.1 MAG: ribosome recycling factor [Candidatus Zambryskibacteria bacterium RIFCSPHIGHO2_02_FULL_39_19]OHA98478.1 MAG: ribosome recycling factor [Candidatus Zambryskibacteria bacterium RIFCSPHIGHO2_12_FULL_39_21]OHB01397.1 MAG: ribosome recycling factor [Candidatus Zambryskibacteria bacterium RIFCSPLO